MWLDAIFLKYRTLLTGGVALPQRAKTNFTGSGVTLTDDPVNDSTTVNVTAGGGGSTPTGTGFTHITSGTQDAAAKKVDLSASADVMSTLGIVNGGTGLTALGGASQALRVNAGGTALEYGTLQAAGGGTGLTAIGMALQFLRVNAGGTALEYVTVTIPSTPTGTGFVHVTGGVQDGAAQLVFDADVGSGAAISGLKIFPVFGAQNVSTTGNVAAGTLTAGTTILTTDANAVTMGGGQRVAMRTTSVSTTLTTSDFHLACTPGAPITVSLPAFPFLGQSYEVKDQGGTASVNNITIDAGLDNIDGASTFVMDQDFQCVVLRNNGVRWNVV